MIPITDDLIRSRSFRYRLRSYRELGRTPRLALSCARTIPPPASHAPPRRLYVKSLYRRYLNNSLNWYIRRDLWRQRAIEIRAEFERNRCVGYRVAGGVDAAGGRRRNRQEDQDGELDGRREEGGLRGEERGWTGDEGRRRRVMEGEGKGSEEGRKNRRRPCRGEGMDVFDETTLLRTVRPSPLSSVVVLSLRRDPSPLSPLPRAPTCQPPVDAITDR